MDNKYTTQVSSRQQLTEQQNEEPDGEFLEPDDPPRFYRPWWALPRNKFEPRFEIRTQLMWRFIIAFPDAKDVIFIPPNRLILTTSHHTFDIKGRNLDELAVLYRRERIGYIQAFNIKHFDEPTEEEKNDRGFIESIDRKERKDVDLDQIAEEEKPVLKEVK